MTENRLAHASSAYLKSAAHQPIDWYEFGEAAFAEAQKSDRLILLDIGAAWCHWCHVIDRESYENEEIARIINEHYIPVKVDRDQRPDIDARYQHIVSAMTGQGGWPLTAFLTFDGRVLYGGTYFPPEVMKKILLQMPSLYQGQKEDIFKTALTERSPESIQAELQSAEQNEAEQHDIPADIFDRFIENAQRAFDPTYGGFGRAPKFPHYSMLEYLIQQAFRRKDMALAPMIHQTLTAMAKGGIYDQIGGGFHRYSVDQVWEIPHFEKMAYDNAEALKVYTQAYRLNPDPLYRQVIEGILQFTQVVLSDQAHGGFYASQDADIDLFDDGDYFTWTLEEVQSVLSPKEAEIVVAYYGMSPQGNMHGRPGRNVLRIMTTADAIAEAQNIPIKDVEDLLKTARQKLWLKRSERPTPFVDKTLYLNWNGMYMAAYFEAADLLEDETIRAFGRRTLDRLLASHVTQSQDQLLHAEGVPGFLEDYAWMIHALIKAYQSTEAEQYLEKAQYWTSVASDLFEDKTYGGFYDTAPPQKETIGLLKFRRKPTEDSPSSSANAIMLRNLVQLCAMTGQEDYRIRAERGLTLFGREFSSYGLFVAALGVTLYDLWHPPAKLEIHGKNDGLKAASRHAFFPGKVITYEAPEDQAEVRVCEGTRCLQPVQTVEALTEQLALV